MLPLMNFTTAVALLTLFDVPEPDCLPGSTCGPVDPPKKSCSWYDIVCWLS